MIDFLKETMRPSSTPLLLLLLTPGVILLFVPPMARWGRRWLAAMIVVYWVLSTPFTVHLLARTLTRGFETVTTPEQVKDAEAVVLLSAGSLNLRAHGEQLPLVSLTTGLRTLEAARIYRMAAPRFVIASGGVTDNSGGNAAESEAMRRALIDLGVPAGSVVPEAESMNTRDQAAVVGARLRAQGITRIALVTSPWHMRRALTLFRAQGLDPIPAVSALVPDGSHRPNGLLPTERALWLGDAVVYEWAASAYYWWNGWLR
jgi:uncharacterized SAM-binding protein YcdF (DUF218 family)